MCSGVKALVKCVASGAMKVCITGLEKYSVGLVIDPRLLFLLTNVDFVDNKRMIFCCHGNRYNLNELKVISARLAL